MSQPMPDTAFGKPAFHLMEFVRSSRREGLTPEMQQAMLKEAVRIIYFESHADMRKHGNKIQFQAELVAFAKLVFEQSLPKGEPK